MTDDDEIEKLRAERDAAIAGLSALDKVIVETANELDCASDNEAILQAIATLRAERDATRDKALADAIAAAEHERLENPVLGDDSDMAYENAISDVVTALCALKTQPKEQP